VIVTADHDCGKIAFSRSQFQCVIFEHVFLGGSTLGMDYQNTTTYEDWLPGTLLAVSLYHLHVVMLTKGLFFRYKNQSCLWLSRC